MCDFSVITRFGFSSLCDNGIKSRSVPFTLDDAFFPIAHGGEEVPWLCVGEATAHRAKRPRAKEVLFDTLSLLPMGGEKNLEGMGEAAIQEITCKRGPIWRALSAAHRERGKPWGYGWGCYPWGQESAYQRGQYHASCEWVDPLTGLCGSVIYLW